MWEDGKRNGKGIQITKPTETIKEGLFENDEFIEESPI